MKIQQYGWREAKGWSSELVGDSRAQWVLVFGASPLLVRKDLLADLQACYPSATLFGCSTGGEIAGLNVHDESLVVTVVRFDQATLRFACRPVGDGSQSRQVGEALARELLGDGLTHVFVLSDGLHVNGSELVRGFTSVLPAQVAMTGGLAGDDTRFQNTYVLWQGQAHSGLVTAMGFYGDALKVGYGSFGGWDPFGPERLITRSKGNTLYELDNKSALALYKTYLGDQAKDLPSSGLLFPLSLRMGEGEPLVRSLLSINEQDQSMTFAGDMPEGVYARLMKANFDRVIDGAEDAARSSTEILGSMPADLAILISCVGRKWILKQRIEEEVEGAQRILGDQVVLTGFYSYGEMAPHVKGKRCELHNQSMTITALRED